MHQSPLPLILVLHPPTTEGTTIDDLIQALRALTFFLVTAYIIDLIRGKSKR